MKNDRESIIFYIYFLESQILRCYELNLNGFLKSYKNYDCSVIQKVNFANNNRKPLPMQMWP